MSAHSPEAVKRQVKIYWMVFAALVVGTIITVAVAKVHMAVISAAITVAVVIAMVKGSLVAGYFMHLFNERKLVYLILALTAVFVVALFGLMLGTFGDHQARGPGVFQVPQRLATPAGAHGHNTAAPHKDSHVP